MRGIKFNVALSVFLLLSVLNLRAVYQQQSVPLPDDDPSRATAAPGKPPLENPASAALSKDDSGAVSPGDVWKETVTLSGIKVDFRIVPFLKDVIVKHGPLAVSLNEMTSAEMVEGQQAVVQFRLTDPTGTPLTGLRLAAWMDQSLAQKPADDKTCHSKIQSFLQMQFSARPEVDLNTYYVLALTREPAILVIDPRIGFSSSKLYALIDLLAPGADWALTSNSDRLFVSMPTVNKVAVVDMLSFRTVANLDAGENPARLALQPDGKYLWISNDVVGNQGGVTVVDADTLKVLSHIQTGKGRHEITFDDGQNAYVTNQADGTVSIINIQKLSKIQDVPVGGTPVALAYSPQGRAVYVASADGKVTAISTESHKVTATITGSPGFSALKISPDGRWVFVANAKENKVLALDVSANKFRQSYNTGHAPDQLALTAAYLYVRSSQSEEVTLIPLAAAGQDISIASFPAGQTAPGEVQGLVASTIVPSLDSASVFVANPADRRVYYYQEGMAAPMLSLEGYGKVPIAALVLDRSIHETSPGIYSVGLRLPKGGTYDVPLFVDSPALHHCFDFAVKVNPLLKKEVRRVVYLQPLKNNLQLRTGEPAQVSFRVLDGATDKPKDGLKDVEVTVLLAEGLRQLRFTAEPAGDGVYQFTLTPPKEGVYYAMVQIPSLKVKANDLPYLMVRATAPQNAEAPPVAAGAAEPKNR